MLALRIVLVEIRAAAHAFATNPRRIEIGSARNRQFGTGRRMLVSFSFAGYGQYLIGRIAGNRERNRRAFTRPRFEVAVKGAVFDKISLRRGIGYEKTAIINLAAIIID